MKKIYSWLCLNLEDLYTHRNEELFQAFLADKQANVKKGTLRRIKEK